MATGKSFSYEIAYTKAAEKFFTTHENIRKQYEQAIRELLIGEHPEKIDVKKIKGKHSEYYRIRLGNYRVIYTIINGKIVVVKTLLAGGRGDVNKKMTGL